MCCHGVGSAQRAQMRPQTDFARPEIQKQRQDPFANDRMEGLRADDMKKVAKKKPNQASILEKMKVAKQDISSMVNDLKKKMFPGDDLPPVASAQPSPNAGAAPSAPVRVV